ncbi:phosphoribosylaminoimidazolesuccinocarboxamide synthase [Neoactinobaculum massilliense]|uniref:phosphoribosylaminoimidazolesuccinocarboxamide synthase n=1 Tax=Neoactinobaculum massilliense TaxID=2364794 RepID=UPI000F54A798|nr:phosphoribosylaminoimidazolesuccinocarboxamide synthase [Neoactinobaculum massilliense]
MTSQEPLYEGKAKKLYEGTEPGTFDVEYLDQATAGDGAKKDHFSGKGALNNEITSIIFEYLTARGIPNHFVARTDATHQVIKKMRMIPLECVVRNYTAGSECRRLGLEQGTKLASPLTQFFFKNDALHDPLVTDDEVTGVLHILTPEQVVTLKAHMLEVNAALLEFFAAAGLILADFKLEYGFDAAGAITLGDEVSPDTCRLWDASTMASLDKDVYRKDTGDLLATYREVLRRIKEVH